LRAEPERSGIRAFFPDADLDLSLRRGPLMAVGAQVQVSISLMTTWAWCGIPTKNEKQNERSI
jgi:hypothetical protein